MTGLLAGKSALVTGAASGIGRATALLMVREGARVLLADRAGSDLDGVLAQINAAGGQAVASVTDVTREDEVAAMLARAVAAFGRLDCAFNNAGIAPAATGSAGQKTAELSEAAWAGVLAVNLTGVFLCMKHELRQMQAQGGGAIVNTASIAGLVGLPGAAAYTASKHGVIGATRAAALEYAGSNIRVNAVCPGYVQTPMTADTVQRRGEALMAMVPQRRLGRPEEIAEAVVWLCADRAGFVTGAAYTIDGGYSAA
ncbi:MAG: SDR family oxidoreductase [Rhodospirillales bacterium]|nr:SDR family oxidoreductase [Rhodospirillales bacterium]MDE2576473.1 SDR family oxidoreductase [Rhodospirillales bacterium]